MRLSFAVAALFGMVAANSETLAEIQQVENIAEPELTFLSEEDSEMLNEEDTELNVQTHKIAEAEVNKLAKRASIWGKQVDRLGGEEKRLKMRDWNHLMRKTQYWKRLHAANHQKFHALAKNMERMARVTTLKNGRKEFHFAGEKALGNQIKALKKADRHLKLVIKRDIQVYFKNEHRINNYIIAKYGRTVKGNENALKRQAKKTVVAVKNDINMVEEDEFDHNKMSLIETIACSAVFVFSCAALAAAALYEPKSKTQAKVIVDNEVAPAPKKQIKKSLDSILKNNNTKVTLI